PVAARKQPAERRAVKAGASFDENSPDIEPGNLLDRWFVILLFQCHLPLDKQFNTHFVKTQNVFPACWAVARRSG
ncbi:MAG: hypothetical protein P4L75_02665, partial [Clostridia bacterium]|nr:hypothetical protein [Clostridia bacterium]